MFKKILCPVDFSDGSRHAVEYATALARISHGSITALYVVSPFAPPEVPGGPEVPVMSYEAREQEVWRVESEVAAMFEDATTRGIRVDVLVDRGQPPHQILMRAADLPADIIVMGTHGAGGFEHLMLGSVAEKVVRKATCPVITVPPHAERADGPFRKIVCAVDFSEWSVAALDAACAIAQENEGSVTAVHVIEWPWQEPPAPDFSQLPPAEAAALLEYRRYQETMAESRLDAMKKDVCGDRCRLDTRIAHGKPYAEILCTAERARADLIVIGVHGRSSLDVFFFGSTTHQVVRRAPCPVLTLRH